MPENTRKYEYESPICSECNKRKRSRGRVKKDGTVSFNKKCEVCRGSYAKKSRVALNSKQRKYEAAIKRKLEHMTCEICPFKAEHRCQLDIDHIDGDKNNNDPSNHMVMCANCHRLKTYTNKDIRRKYS